MPRISEEVVISGPHTDEEGDWLLEVEDAEAWLNAKERVRLLQALVTPEVWQAVREVERAAWSRSRSRTRLALDGLEKLLGERPKWSRCLRCDGHGCVHCQGD